MAVIAPPPAPPRVGAADDDRMRRFRRRLTLALAASVTVVATGWACTLGILPAIISLMVAKHVLVAILMMGLGVDARRGELR
jgi:hypothetical protein